MKILPTWNRLLGLLALIVTTQPAFAGQITGRLLLDGSLAEFAAIAFRMPASPTATYFGSQLLFMGDERFSTADDLPAGSYESGTFSDLSIYAGYLVPRLTGLSLSEGQVLDIGDIEVLSADRIISGTVSGTAPFYVDIVSTTTTGGVEYVVWSQADSETGEFRLPAVNGTWTVRFERFQSITSQIQVTVFGSDVTGLQIGDAPTSPFIDWVKSYGLEGLLAEIGADPDRDGFINEMEFAFGTDPTKPTGSLTTATRSGGEFTVAWLERTDGLLGYFVRESTDLNTWKAAAVTVDNGSTSPTPPEGYVRRQFSVPATGKKFYCVLSTDNPDGVPDQSFKIRVANEPVTVERWGNGHKALVFFGYVPFFMEQDLKTFFADQFRGLVGEEYSMFLWTYPESGPFAGAEASIDDFFADPESALATRLNFTGQASTVVSQIRAATGLTDICLVGNSFGAGVVMWDLAALANDPKVRFVLISPTEVFMPFTLPAAKPLPRTVLVADAARDPYFANQFARDYITARTNAPLPTAYNPGSYPWQDGHFIIGQYDFYLGKELVPLSYVFSLINEVYQQP